MDRGYGHHGKPPEFDGVNYPFWKIKMQAHLMGVDWRVWEIVEDPHYEVLAARVGQEQIDQHNANSRARSLLFSALRDADFERVSNCSTAREIWKRLENYHEGTPQVKNRVYEAYKREYDNLVQLEGESIDALFARAQSIINKMKANKPTMVLDDHERAIKLLYALDRKVWEVKVNALQEFATLDDLTVDKLYSKLKSSELDAQIQAKIRNPSAPTMALVSGKTSSSSSANSSQCFALSSLVYVTEEQLECLGNDELALVIGRFSRFHNNRLNRRWGGGQKDGCFGCGDPDHYVANCPKKARNPDFGKNTSGRTYGDRNAHSSGRRKDKHTDEHGDKHKEKLKRYGKEYIKKKFLKKMKAKEQAFIASLSDIELSDDNSAPSSDDESEEKIEEKLNGLCFFTNSVHGGFCTMALEDSDIAGVGKPLDEDSTPEVSPTIESLSSELDSLNEALLSQSKLLKRACKDRKEFREKWESALKELEFARSSVHISEETECDECAVHMSNFASLQTRYATLMDEIEEMRARPLVLGACKSCPGLRSELAKKDVKLALFEKASSESTDAKCSKCEALELEVTNCRHEKMRVGEENTYLYSILNWVSSSEPQLGMMVSQFKRGTDTTGLGFAIGGKGEVIYGKVGQGSGLSDSEKNPIPPKLTKITPPKPTQPLVKDGVVQETPKAPPSKQVWIPKPNHLRNPLDTLPSISEDLLPRARAPFRVIPVPRREYQEPSRREVRYHCEYCQRDGHLVEFCFRRK